VAQGSSDGPLIWPRRAIKGLFALALALALPVSGADAADVAGLQARVDQAKTQARSLAANVELRTAELGAATSRAVAASHRQQALEVSLAEGRARLGRLKFAAAQAHERLLDAQARYRRSQRQLSRRLVAIYKADTPDLTTVLLESDGFNDLLTRVAYLKEINTADTALVQRVEALRDGVRGWLERVRDLRGLASDQVVRIASARDAVVQIRAQAEARAATLRRARAAQQAALATLRSRMAGWTAQVRALQAASGQGGSAGQTVGRWLGDFSIPTPIVMCESGGNYNAINPSSGAGGAYQMLPETYKGLGGKYKAPQVAPKWEQDQLAAKLWNGGAGRGNWAC
jgi:predicted  nucleic acid-binding Zn-ribbon protein